MPDQDESFDPYRFGHPETPPPPEFAPPGYRPPAVDLSKPTPPPGPPVAPPPYGYGHPQQYAPPSYPYPPYQPNPQYQQPRGGTSGKAIAGLVLGILALALFWLTIFDVVFIVLGLIFGILGLNEARTKRLGGRGQAIAGLVCTGLGAVLAVVTLTLFVRAADHCGGIDNQDAPGFNQCVEDHLFS